MAALERSALVPFSAERMFALVNDVRRYPEFVPWCAGAEVLAETDALIEASLCLKRGGVEHRFTTRNTLTPVTAMRLELVDGGRTIDITRNQGRLGSLFLEAACEFTSGSRFTRTVQAHHHHAQRTLFADSVAALTQ